MAKLYVKEYIEGYRYYEMEITEQMVQNMCDNFSEYISNFVPLTLVEVLAIMNDDTTCERYFENYKDRFGNPKLYLNSMIHEWMLDEAWLHEVSDTLSVIDIETKIEK